VESSTATTSLPRGYRHEAFFYRSEAEFLVEVIAFVRDGVEAGEPTMVALPEPRLSLVKTTLGEDAEEVQFVDMAEFGANPARIITAWLSFMEECCVGGQKARGVNELLFAARRPVEVVECQLHEALLNLAVPSNAPLWLRCPYDVSKLDAAVLSDAAASHPTLFEDGAYQASKSYGCAESIEVIFRRDLPEPTVATVDLPLGASGSSAVADLVRAHALGAGLDDDLTGDLLVAVEDLAANSLGRGPAPGNLRVWLEPGVLVCEVTDRGYIDDPLVGLQVSGSEQTRARGLWDANQVCDLVQVRSTRNGTAARVHIWLPRLAAGTKYRARPAIDGFGAGLDQAARQLPPEAPGYLRVVASDLDGTLTDGGPVSADVLAGLDEARARGVLVILVTGRRLSHLDEDHPGLRRHVDAAVLENGAVLMGPRGMRLLAAPVPKELTDALTRHGVPHRTGTVVVDCDNRDAHRILDVLQETGLDHQMVRNRAALMLLPAGVTKGTGLMQALAEFGLSRHNAVGVGDAENDESLFDACELGVAVANATPALQARADMVLQAPAGEGITELLLGPLLRPEATLSSRRWRMTLGHTADGTPVQVPASPSRLLVTGDSGSGKSFLTGLIVEQLTELEYSSLIIDPEGDHAALSRLPGILTVGRDGFLPPPDVLVDMLTLGRGTLVLDLSQQRLGDVGPLRADSLAARLHDYFTHLACAVQDSRRQAGRPHWLVVDEADSLFAAGGPLLPLVSPGWGLCLTTYRPDRLAPQVHSTVQRTVQMDSQAPGKAVLLNNDATVSAASFSVSSRRSPHVRHQHKYAEGSVPSDRRFVFRDDQGAVAARAANVHEFAAALRQASPQVIAHHMRGGDFTRWIHDVLGDAALAQLVHAVERSVAGGGDAHTSRNTVVALVERRYLGTGRTGGGRRSLREPQ
jgi:hydroxymethylpyrimidine pyrophosphatase-like HAD family hydrolase/anti-sigma regulatory factor (Ser/Thr protein kinase)